MENEQIKKRSAKAMGWSLLTQLAPKLITPIVNMVLARLLAPEAFGAIATINLVITFAEIFTDAGFQKYIVQHEFENDEELDKNTNVAFWTNIFVSFIFIAGIVIFRNPIANLVGSPGLGLAIAISSINILLVTLCSTQTARYNRIMDFKTLFYARICMVFVPLAVTIPLAVVFRNYWALLIGTLATNFLNALVLTIFSKWKPRLYFNFKLFKEMFAFSSWLLLDSVVVWLTSYIGTFIVSRQLSDYHLGLYKTSITTVSSITNIITMAIGPVMFSQLSRCQGDDIEMKETYYKYQRLSAIILIPLGVGMFVFSDLVTWVLLGSQWGDAVDFIGIWALMSTIAIVLNNFCSTFFRSKGKPKIALMLQIIYFAVYLPTILWAVKKDFDAFCLINSLLMICPIINSNIVMKFVFRFKTRQTICNVLPMVLSAILMGAIGFLVKNLVSGIWWQFISVFICIILYFSILFLFPKTRKEIFDIPIIKKFISRKNITTNKITQE